MTDYSLTHYAVKSLIADHELVVERDTATKDAFGSESARAFTPLGTFKGHFWWWPVRGEGGFDETSTVERTVVLGGGGAILDPGVDIREGDRVTEVRKKGKLIVDGPFRVTSVRDHPDHTELSVESP